MGAACVSSSGEKAMLSCSEQMSILIDFWIGLFLGALREGQCKADDWCVMSVFTHVCAQGEGGHLMEEIWRARASHHSFFHYCSPSRNCSVKCMLLLSQCCHDGAAWKHAFPLQSGSDVRNRGIVDKTSFPWATCCCCLDIVTHLDRWLAGLLHLVCCIFWDWMFAWLKIGSS